MSLKIEVHLSDLIQQGESLSDEEYHRRLSEKIEATIAHYDGRGWSFSTSNETEDGVVLHFYHKLPDLW